LDLEEKMNKVMGVVMVGMALVLAIVPFFTDCQSQGRALTLQDGRTVPMKCHWTGIAEIGAAVPLALAGVFNLKKQRKETTRFLATIGGGAGALAILFPTVLIGVCANPDMVCNMIMRPTLIAAGAIAIGACIVLFVNVRQPETGVPA
jgi:hypothetical protein